MKKTAAVAGLIAFGMALAGCAAATEAKEPTTTPEPSVEAVEEAAPQGTRENPVPFGESYTFENLGEAGGPAWTVTIDEPRDMGAEILAEATELYGDDESYLATFRPEPGTIFLGYTGTVERLLDTPADPGSDLDNALIGTDGNTYNAIVLGIGGPEEALVNIAEMYSPATARFSDVQVVPEGVDAGQVLITMRNTGESIYFGNEPVTEGPAEAPTEAPVSEGGVGVDALKADWTDNASDESKQTIRSQWEEAQGAGNDYEYASFLTDQFNGNGFQVTVDEVEEFLNWSLTN